MIQIFWYTNEAAENLMQLSDRLSVNELTQAMRTPVVNRNDYFLSDISAAQFYNRKVTLEVEADESSYRLRQLMQKTQLQLKFKLPYFIAIPVGAWIVFQNERYTLLTDANLKKNGERNIEYTLEMGADDFHLSRYKLRNTIDGRLKFSMCARPHEFIAEIVENLNRRDGENVWSVGTCLEANEQTVEFNHSYLDAALSAVAEAFETEWEIDGHTISLHKIEYHKDNPLALSYGRGNGFVPGVGRSSSSSERPVEILYVQGGEQNIDRASYRDSNGALANSSCLLLPKSQTLEYEGRTYVSSADGLSIRNANRTVKYNNEDSVELTEIYPMWEGEVTSIEIVNAEKNFYDILDNTIPSTLNFSNYLIEGETMTIIFQSGMLAGREFEVKYKHDTRRFELVPIEEDGQTMPNNTFTPAVGDKYRVFNTMLPQDYICNNELKTGASWELFREAARHLYENEDQKFTFKGELQGLWAKRNWVNVGGYLKCGSYIHFTDNQFAVDGVDIRIVSVKDFLHNPHAPTVELSNSVSGSSVSSALNKITQQEVLIEQQKGELIRFTKRRFRDAQETQKMLSKSLLSFSEAIDPITVRTMSMLIGDESLQFYFVSDTESYQQKALNAYYDADAKQFCIRDAGFLQHQTLGITGITAPNSNVNKLVWSMPDFTSAVLDDAAQKYWLYAVVPKTGDAGEFLLSDIALDLYTDDEHYYLLVGILNSEYENERSYVSMYGYTEILPGRITTDRIVSADGESFFDLVGNAFHLGTEEGGFIDWNNLTENTLTLNNATIKDALKVLGEALIAGFYFSDTVIRSTMMLNASQSAMTLDGVQGAITLRSNTTGGDYSLDGGRSSVIKINASSGEIEVRNDRGVSYMSASGVFCNNPRTNAMPLSSGYTHYGSIVGLGFGDNVNNDWMFDTESTIVAGVYGRADNTGNAPAFGGFFYNLFAGGLVLKSKYITDSAATTSVRLSALVTQCIGLTNLNKIGTVYLPTSASEGQVIYAKQLGQGTMRFYPSTGHKIFDDISENEYYDCAEGQELKFTFCKFSLNNASVSAWAVSRWKF